MWPRNGTAYFLSTDMTKLGQTPFSHLLSNVFIVSEELGKIVYPDCESDHKQTSLCHLR